MTQLWTVEDLARFLGVPVQTIYQWRHRGYGPKGRKVGRYIRYKPDEVMAWVDGLNDQPVLR